MCEWGRRSDATGKVKEELYKHKKICFGKKKTPWGFFLLLFEERKEELQKFSSHLMKNGCEGFLKLIKKIFFFVECSWWGFCPDGAPGMIDNLKTWIQRWHKARHVFHSDKNPLWNCEWKKFNYDDEQVLWPKHGNFYIPSCINFEYNKFIWSEYSTLIAAS